MKADGEQVLLRIYVRATDRHRLEPVYQVVVRAARERGLAGATVLQGVHGYGGNHEHRAAAMGHDVPVVVEMIDAGARVRDFVQEVLARELGSAGGGLVTLERAHVMVFRQRAGEAAEARLAMAPTIAALSTVPELERSDAMRAIDGVLLRVFLGEGDASAGGGVLYRAIVDKARELGLRGATVLRGSMGYGVHGALHSGQILEHAGNLPVVIEIADERANIERLLPFLEQTIREGMLTMEDVRMAALRRDS